MAIIDLTPQRKEILSGFAEHVAERYCSESNVIMPEKIAENIGLRFKLADYGKAFDGLLVCKSGKHKAFLNTHDGAHLHDKRLRFSFAHELGHFLIDEHRISLSEPGVKPRPSFNHFDSNDLMEKEADHFAANLLMPRKRILRDIGYRKFSYPIIDEISNKYNVSATAAIIRFITLGNKPVMVVCSRDKMVRWKSNSDDFPHYKLLYGNRGRVPENTSAGEYFYEGTKNMGKTEPVFAEDWFELRYASERRQGFFEYCIYQENLNQVISLIWQK